jgi:hypothetical protein
MESIINNQPGHDPASVPACVDEQEMRPQPVGNKLQFEEVVQRLQKEMENHPNPARGTFY